MMQCTVFIDHSLCVNISGLIDDNESVETAALRELKEETGYKGEVVGITPGTAALMCVCVCISVKMYVTLHILMSHAHVF